MSWKSMHFVWVGWLALAACSETTPNDQSANGSDSGTLTNICGITCTGTYTCSEPGGKTTKAASVVDGACVFEDTNDSIILACDNSATFGDTTDLGTWSGSGSAVTIEDPSGQSWVCSLDPGGEPGSGGSPACDIYLACVELASPATYKAVLAVYGESGTCWDDRDPDSCDEACLQGTVETYHASNYLEACNRCSLSADCPKNAPVCDTVESRCVGCQTNTDCARFDSAQTIVCNSPTGACVQCTTHHECKDLLYPECIDNKCQRDDGSCNECVNTECMDEYQSCSSSNECYDALRCAQGCVEDTCVDQCVGQSGGALFEDLWSCIEESCDSLCTLVTTDSM